MGRIADGAAHTEQLIAGRYRLGSGGGEVYRATEVEAGRVVALWRTGAPPGADGRTHRLRRDVKILAKLNHPNVVTPYELVADGDELWLVTEYVPARSLAERGTVPPAEAAAIGASIANALRTMHAAGVIHGHITPDVVLLGEDGRVRLGGFGRVDTEATSGFPAPEAVAATPASDMFSLGATLSTAVATPGPLAPVLSALAREDPAERPTAERARALLAGVAGRRAARPARRVRTAATAGVAAVAAIAALVSWLMVDPPPEIRAARPPVATSAAASPVARAPVSLVDDPRTADPCALADPAALKRFGNAVRGPADGEFNRCDIRVRAVDVRIQLGIPDTPPVGQVRTVGALRVVREPSAGQECDRDVLLADRYVVNIAVTRTAPGPADLCGLADAATDGALKVLARGPIPARAPAPGPTSLINANACALPDATALARLPGVDARHPSAGFGDWTCRWLGTAGASVLVTLDRDRPLTAADGRPIRLRGHDAFVASDGDACRVGVVHRRYVDATGQPTVERMLVAVTGSRSTAQRCRQATDLAGSAIANLPT